MPDRYLPVYDFALMSLVRLVINKWFDPLAGSTKEVVKEDTKEMLSSYDLPAPSYLEFDKAYSASVPPPESFLNSISLRFGGFEKQFNSLIAPLDEFESSSPYLIRNYFINSLGATVDLARKRPAQAQKLLVQKNMNGPALYERLVAVACGNSNSVLSLMDVISRSQSLDEPLLLDCLREVGKYRPYETSHLLLSLFNRATLKTKVNVIRKVVHSPLIGDKHLVGDLFVSLFSNSVSEERRNDIYPGLLSIIDEAPLEFPEVMIKRGFLSALLHGWMSEV